MWAFAQDHPFITLIIVFLLWLMLCLTVETMWCRLMRMLAVRKAGWPPAHLDADGSFRSGDTDTDRE